MSVLPEIMVVRDGNGGHAQLIGPVEKLLYGRKSVQDGVLGVDMEVNETHGDTKITNLPRKPAKKLSTCRYPAICSELEGEGQGGQDGHRQRAVFCQRDGGGYNFCTQRQGQSIAGFEPPVPADIGFYFHPMLVFIRRVNRVGVA